MHGWYRIRCNFELDLPALLEDIKIYRGSVLVGCAAHVDIQSAIVLNIFGRNCQ